MIHGNRSLTGFHPVHAIDTADVPVPTSAIARFYHTFRKWEYSLAGLWHPNSLIGRNLKIDTFASSVAIGFWHPTFQRGGLTLASAYDVRIDSFESFDRDYPVNGKSPQSATFTGSIRKTPASRDDHLSRRDRSQAGAEVPTRIKFG